MVFLGFYLQITRLHIYNVNVYVRTDIKYVTGSSLHNNRITKDA